MSRTDKDRPDTVRGRQDGHPIDHRHGYLRPKRVRYWLLDANGNYRTEVIERTQRIGDFFGPNALVPFVCPDYLPPSVDVIEDRFISLDEAVRQAKLLRSTGADLDARIVVGTQLRYLSVIETEERVDTCTPKPPSWMTRHRDLRRVEDFYGPEDRSAARNSMRMEARLRVKQSRTGAVSDIS